MPIPYIIVLVVILVIIILLYFVEPLMTRQKISNNNEHGSARWATKNEIKKTFTKEKINTIKESGFPVYYSKDNKEIWFDKTTPHWIYLGSTGSGKSVTAVIPQCSFIATAKKKKSVFITDPKGEIFSTTSKMFKENGYKILILDFRHPSLSNHLNVLEPIIKEYEEYIKYEKLSLEANNDKKEIEYRNKSIMHLAECNELIASISKMIMSDETAKEAFWNNSASDLLYGLIALFLEDYTDGKINRNQITLSSIKKFQNSSMASSNLNILKKYVENKEYGLKSKDKLIPIISTSENTYRSITSIFNERMTIFDDINVENILSESDFSFDILGKSPTVLYFCIPDESKIYYALVSIVVSLIYRRLVALCNTQTNCRLPYDLVFLLDEFANTPPLPDIENLVSVARSRGMQFQFFIQSFAQLDNLYGKEVSQIIQDNCGLAYLKTNTQETAEAISLRLGNHGVQTTSLNYSMSFTNNNGNKGISLISRRLMTADEIKDLHYKTIIFSTISHPIFRETVIYKKFKCYQNGEVKRKVRPLKKMVSTYYTVENIKLEENKQNNVIEQSKEELKEKETLMNILNQVLKIFGNVDFETEFVKEKNGNWRADLYIAPPLSTHDLTKLEELSKKLNFSFNAIGVKEKVKLKNKNSKIEISINTGEE